MTAFFFRLIKIRNCVFGWIFPGSIAAWAVRVFLTPQRFPTPRWELELSKDSRAIVLPGNLKANVWGKDDSRSKVLLVHGWNGRGTQLSTFAQPLLIQGFQVIALDGPAHGASPGSTTNMGVFADHLVEVGRALGPLHGLIGHSFGGSAGLLAASRGLAVDCVVTIGSPCYIEKIFQTFRERVSLPAPAYRKFRQKVELLSGVEVSKAVVGEWGRVSGVRGLVVHSDDDDLVPYSEAEAMAQIWSKARLLSVKGKGHHKILRDPEVVEAVVKFLSAK